MMRCCSQMEKDCCSWHKGSYSLAVARYNGNEDPGPIITKLKKWLHHHGITWDDKPGNNISYYSVQRSTDGAAFKEIARILHNSNTANYNFEDPLRSTAITITGSPQLAQMAVPLIQISCW